MKPTVGVFQIKNMKNGMVLIEASTNISSKWNRHRTELKFGSHRNKTLQKDWNIYGETNFMFSILSELKISEDTTIDTDAEVNLLKEMLEEEINITQEMKY